MCWNCSLGPRWPARSGQGSSRRRGPGACGCGNGGGHEGVNRDRGLGQGCPAAGSGRPVYARWCQAGAAPSKATIRRVITDADPEAFDATVGRWLMSSLTAGPSARTRTTAQDSPRPPAMPTVTSFSAGVPSPSPGSNTGSGQPAHRASEAEALRQVTNAAASFVAGSGSPGPAGCDHFGKDLDPLSDNPLAEVGVAKDESLVADA